MVLATNGTVQFSAFERGAYVLAGPLEYDFAFYYVVWEMAGGSFHSNYSSYATVQRCNVGVVLTTKYIGFDLYLVAVEMTTRRICRLNGPTRS